MVVDGKDAIVTESTAPHACCVIPAAVVPLSDVDMMRSLGLCTFSAVFKALMSILTSKQRITGKI